MSTSIDQSTDIDLLTRRLQNAHKSIAFIQNEHATTLNELHAELAKWQQKYSGTFIATHFSSNFHLLDLIFRLTIGNSTVSTGDDGKRHF